MAGRVSTPGATVTGRALALLGAFDEEHRRLTLSDLAQRADLPLPTAHRLVGELVGWGALSRVDSGHYVVGRRLWDLGMLAPLQGTMVERASPYLHDLYAATLATVHLAARDGQSALYLDRLRGHASVPVVSTIGSRLPLHATGVGKVLLAHAPEQVAVAVLSGPLERITPYTVTQPGRLRRQLGRCRSDGYATTSEEMSLGACSVAVPVLQGGLVVAALGVVVPSLAQRPRLVAALQVAAQGVGRELSRLAPPDQESG